MAWKIFQFHAVIFHVSRIFVVHNMSIRPGEKPRNAGFIRYSPSVARVSIPGNSFSSRINQENINFPNKSSLPNDKPLNEIAERVRQMEKLVLDAMREDSADFEDLTRKHNQELEGILYLLKTHISDSMNDLIMLIEEESLVLL